MATKPKPVPFSSWAGLPYVPGSKPLHPQWASLPSLPSAQLKPKKKTKSPSVKSQAQSFGYWTGGAAALPIPPAQKKPKKKAKPKEVVSVEPNGHHKDMMGRHINQGDYVLAVQNNRPFPFKVLKLNATTLSIVPAIRKKDITHRAMGGSIPAYKSYRREGWNVYLIPKEEIFMYNLTGNVTE